MLNHDALARVRKLLAVAEHPHTPPEEADNAARAAERMIAKHAIDETLLEAAGPTSTRPQSRTVVVEAPYATAKTTLVGAVASAYGVRAINVRNGDGPRHVILVGFPSDLQAVDMLYTSLLLQATTSVRRQTERGRAFRRAFLIGFAAEVGDRLRAAHLEAVADAGGASTALVLRNRESEVEAAVRHRFPHLRTTRMTISDRRGLIAGRQSGSVADLASGANQVGGSRTSITGR